jgi:hypothetical protein
MMIGFNREESGTKLTIGFRTPLGTRRLRPQIYSACHTSVLQKTHPFSHVRPEPVLIIHQSKLTWFFIKKSKSQHECKPGIQTRELSVPVGRSSSSGGSRTPPAGDKTIPGTRSSRWQARLASGEVLPLSCQSSCRAASRHSLLACPPSPP